MSPKQVQGLHMRHKFIQFILSGGRDIFWRLELEKPYRRLKDN